MFEKSRPLFALLALQALVAAGPSHSLPRVWVVAPTAGPGVDFTDIQSAVTAAADGDTILVRVGTYAPFVVDGKSLVVVGDGTVTLQGTVTDKLLVRNVSAARSVVLRNFTGFTQVAIESCSGPVTLEALQMRSPSHGCDVTGATALTLTECSFTSLGNLVAKSGLVASNSTVHVQDSHLGGSSSTQLGSGGHGVELQGTRMIATGSTFAGGRGANAQTAGVFCVTPPGNGGHAVSLSASDLTAVNCALLPGQPGFDGAFCPPASFGSRISGSGTSTEVAGPSVQWTAPSPVRSATTTTFTVRGTPSSQAWLCLGAMQSPFVHLACNGTLLPDLASLVIVMLGPIPSTGQLAVPVPVPASLPADAVTLTMQAGLLTGTGACWLGRASAVTIVDARF